MGINTIYITQNRNQDKEIVDGNPKQIFFPRTLSREGLPLSLGEWERKPWEYLGVKISEGSNSEDSPEAGF